MRFDCLSDRNCYPRRFEFFNRIGRQLTFAKGRFRPSNPGRRSFETPMMARPDFAQWVRERIPAGRVGQPEDVAAAVVFAAWPAASLMTDTSLVVDGGWTAQ